MLPNKLLRAALPALLAVLAGGAVLAQPICCYNCGSGGPAKLAVAKQDFQQRSAWNEQRSRVPASALPDLDLKPSRAAQRKFIGSIAGTWDNVDGYITIPYPVDGTGELDILLRGFPAEASGEPDTYRIPKWDRSLYWLEMDNQPPRLLQALELTADYVPVPGDDYHDSMDNGPGTVTGDCTLGAGCTLNLIPYLRYREAGADYSAPTFPRDNFLPGNSSGFIEVGMSFVTDADGDAIDARVLFDGGRAEAFFVGDSIQMATLAYKIDEPEYIYALGYAAFVDLDESATISRRQYVPGVDFADPSLPEDLNAGSRPIRLIIDASVSQGDDYSQGGGREGSFAYGGPFEQGFTWQQAPAHIEEDSFERPRVVPQAGVAKQRSSWIRVTPPSAADAPLRIAVLGE